MRRVLAYGAGTLGRAIAAALPGIVARSLRRGLRQLYLRGDLLHHDLHNDAALPPGGLVLACNHHSWWDLYLALWLRARLGRPFSGVMDEDTLERFPFFRRHGAIGQGEVREALRRLAAGHILLVFVEGDLRQAGPLREFKPGLAFFTRKANVPVVPLALRVVLRGAEKPEAFMALGAALAPAPEIEAEVRDALNALLTDLDRTLLEAHPEAPPPGFTPVWPPARRFDERAARLAGLWRGRA